MSDDPSQTPAMPPEDPTGGLTDLEGASTGETGLNLDAAAGTVDAGASHADDDMTQDDLDALMSGANAGNGESFEPSDGFDEADDLGGAQESFPSGSLTPNLPNFDAAVSGVDPSRVTMLNDVKLRVKIELGRARMLVEDVLKLGEGAVVELDKLAGDPVDVYVNDRLVARGEVLVLNDNFCVRISDVISTDPHRVSA